jgi:oligopeptidase B
MTHRPRFAALAALLCGQAALSAPPKSVPPKTASAQKVSMTDPAKPPVAAQKPHSYERHGVKIDDPYSWLKDEGYPKVDDVEVLDYLKAENAYFETQIKPLAPLVETIFQEM